MKVPDLIGRLRVTFSHRRHVRSAGQRGRVIVGLVSELGGRRGARSPGAPPI